MDSPERHDAGNPAAGPDDDLAADLLAKHAVGRADIAGALGRDRGRFQAVAVLLDRGRRFVDDLVLGRSPVLERQIEAWKFERRSDDVGSKNAQRFLEQLLTGLVAFENDDRASSATVY